MKSLENQGFSFFLSYDMIESVTVQRQRNRLEKQRKSGVEKMSRVIVVTDSNSGITQSEAKELGVVVMPMPFYINGQMFYEDIDLTQEQFYQKLKEGGEIKTSMPLVGDVTDKWDELLKEYDEIVYIPMSSGLSSSCETAYMLSQDYDGKVQVVNNQRISVTMRQSVLDAKMLAEQGKGAEEIKEILEKEKFESSIYIMVDTLEYLKKGGRISSTVAFIGGALAIKPVVAVSDGEIIMLGKARGSKNGSNFLIREIEKADGVDFSRPFCLGYTGLSDELLQKYIHDSEHLWKDYAKELPISTLGATIGTHVGPGAVAVAFFEH
jgi:DegV family protein with EDD domain